MYTRTNSSTSKIPSKNDDATHADIYTKTETTTTSSLSPSFNIPQLDSISSRIGMSRKRVLIIDGVGYPAVGSICGTDNADVARACGYPIWNTDAYGEDDNMMTSTNSRYVRERRTIDFFDGKSSSFHHKLIDTFKHLTYSICLIIAMNIPSYHGFTFRMLNNNPHSSHNLSEAQRRQPYFVSSSSFGKNLGNLEMSNINDSECMYLAFNGKNKVNS